MAKYLSNEAAVAKAHKLIDAREDGLDAWTFGRPEDLVRRGGILDDNSRFEIDRDCVLGRDPHDSDAVERGLRPVRIDDRTGEMSRAHVEIRLVNGDVVIVDRHSTNGVFVRDPAQHGWTRLAPWEPAKWLPGASVLIGGRTLHLHAPTTHRPLQRPHVNVRYDVSKQLHAKAKIA